ncbi:MAG: succinate dehydrogenase cytochrome b subunit [Bacteroidia bacterium]|nr:succinate dehydrogenase cytochrome b subunit [Bacteroidia bacterium]
MSTVVNIFTHSIGKKLIMALTGLFLILFLVGHLAGNFLLFKDDGGNAFNVYAKFMTTNGVVKILSYTTYISIVVHAIYALVLTLYNRKARPVQYAYTDRGANSLWNSRNMGVLGTIVLIFLVIHLRSFWYEMKAGSIPMVTIDGMEYKNLYLVVQEAFKQLWYVLLYVLAMAGLSFHLAHGFWSAFQTLGLDHKAYTPVVKVLGITYALVVPLLFAAIPVFMYIKFA